MDKIKTHKAFAKRVKITGRKKIIHKRARQDHFNAKERGRNRINKRREVEIDPSKRKMIKKAGLNL